MSPARGDIIDLLIKKAEKGMKISLVTTHGTVIYATVKSVDEYVLIVRDYLTDEFAIDVRQILGFGVEKVK